MARMVLHRTPVTVRHPVTHQWLGLRRGDELADDDPIVLDPTFAWLFEDTPEPAELTSVPIEQATAAPGERRSTRRKPVRKAAGE